MNLPLSSTAIRTGSIGVLISLVLASCGGAVPTPSASSVPLTTSANPSTIPTLQALWTGQKGAPADYLHAVAWRPDGQQIAAGYRRVDWAKGPYYQSTIDQVWDVQSGRALHTFQECGIPAPLKWSPNGQYLLCGSKLFTSTFRLASTQLSVNTASYNDTVDWSPDSTQLVVAYGSRSNYRLELFDRTNGNSLGVLNTPREIISVSWSPDGRKIAVNEYYELVVYDVPSGTVLFRTGATTPGSMQDKPAQMAWSADSSRIAVTANLSGSRKPILYLLDAATGSIVVQWSLPTLSQSSISFGPPMSWSVQKNLVAIGDQAGDVHLIDLSNGQDTKVWSNPLNRDVTQLRWSPDGSKLLVGYNNTNYYDRSVNNVSFKVWDYATGSSVLDLSTNLDGHDASNVYGLSVSPDGTQLASAGRDGTVRLWDASIGFNLTKLSDHNDAVYGVAWSPDGETLASSGVDGTLRLWDPLGNAKGVLTGHTYTVRSLAWSPDGLQLASASWDRSIRLWNPVSGTQTALLSGHSSYVNAVGYSPNGQTLASASDDGTLKLWNPSSGALLRTLVAHPDGVLCLAWSPDGTRLATGGRGSDPTLRGVVGIPLKAQREGVRVANPQPSGAHRRQSQLGEAGRGAGGVVLAGIQRVGGLDLRFVGHAREGQLQGCA